MIIMIYRRKIYEKSFRTTTAASPVNLNFSVLPADATASDVEIAVADEKIAPVLNKKLTPVAAGETEITVTAANGVTATAKITVQQAPTEITLKDGSLQVGYSGKMLPITVPAKVDVGAEFTYKGCGHRRSDRR